MHPTPAMHRYLPLLFSGLLSLTHASLLTVDVSPLALEPCGGQFVMHELAHTTQPQGERVSYYDSNGAGVAVGDLNGNGLLDIVLANLQGPNRILWNRGDFVFEAEALSHGGSRAVAIVDVDADGLLDIVFTQSLGSLSYWRNTGAGFTRQLLPGVLTPAYTMLWDDLEGSGTLGLVTASYDVLLEKELGNTFLFSAGAGVMVYRQQGGVFYGTRLSRTAQALALALFDITGDGQRELIVGNDFGIPDGIWRRTPAGWQTGEPFTTSTRNTMSFDSGDTTNDGRLELFATDMKPDFASIPTLAAWLPLMQRSYQRQVITSSQKEANALQVWTHRGFQNLAYQRGVDATGWSWSGVFGDLDNDGYLDLYVVNGMIARDILSHLPNDELREANIAFRNDGRGYFRRALEWRLGSPASGRGMVMADLNNNGRLDIVVNNLASPSIVFENQLCGGQALSVELHWPSSGNTYALGARLYLATGMGTLLREVKSATGYLSAQAPRVHFGFPEGTALKTLTIHWPDGRISELDTLIPHSHMHIRREDTP